MGSTLGRTAHPNNGCLRQRATISSPLRRPATSGALAAISLPFPGSRPGWARTRPLSSTEHPALAELDLPAGEVIRGCSELGARDVREVLHVVAIEEVEPPDQHGERIAGADPDRLLETRVERAVGLGAEAIARRGRVPLVDEAIAVEVLQAARAEGEPAAPGEEGGGLESPGQADEAAGGEDVRGGLVGGTEVGVRVVVVAEGGAHAAGQQVVLVPRVRVGHEERIAMGVALPERDGQAVVLDVALVGDLVDAGAAVAGPAEVGVAGGGGKQVDDAAGQGGVAAAGGGGGGEGEGGPPLLPSWPSGRGC